MQVDLQKKLNIDLVGDITHNVFAVNNHYKYYQEKRYGFNYLDSWSIRHKC